MEPTTFAAMKAMQAQGYISRQQLPTNKKNIYIHLTAKGRGLKAKLVPHAEETNRISSRNVDAADLAIARKVLLTMIANLAEDELGQVEPSPRKPVRPAQTPTPY